jgi:DNA polymerase gamma 1
MSYLSRKYSIDCRLLITIHDEIRFLVREQDAERATLALQISNLWTRALFAESVGIRNLPLSVAFFSSVDVDHVLRKEVDLECKTPSFPEGITKHGKSFTIYDLKHVRLEHADVPAIDLPKPKAPFLDQIRRAGCGGKQKLRVEDEKNFIDIQI